MESDYFRSGTLYWIEESPLHGKERRGRYIWFCGACSPRFVVQGWRPPGEQLQRAVTHVLQPEAARIQDDAQRASGARVMRKD